MESPSDQGDLLVREIDPPIRQWIERIVGRHLADDERVCLVAYHPSAGHGGQRHEARERLLHIMDQAAARVAAQGTPEAGLDAIIEEAMETVRGPRSSAAG